MPNLFWVLAKAVFFVLGLAWCREIFGRLRKDVEELRNSRDNVARGVIVLLWVVTIFVIRFLVYYVWDIVQGVIRVINAK